MRNKNFLIIVFLVMFVLFLANNFVYAGMADYTEEDAEKDNQKMIQEHKEEFDSTKSDDNYLKELTVKGSTISPSFDRQTVEYSVTVNSNINEIEIIASSEDNRAKVKGVGKIDISNISECKIEVVAESGTTRTYFIKIIKENKSNTDNTNEIKETMNNNLVEYENTNIATDTIEIEELTQELTENESESENKYKNINKYVIGLIVLVLVLIVFFICIKIKPKRTKH